MVKVVFVYKIIYFVEYYEEVVVVWMVLKIDVDSVVSLENFVYGRYRGWVVIRIVVISRCSFGFFVYFNFFQDVFICQFSVCLQFLISVGKLLQDIGGEVVFLQFGEGDVVVEVKVFVFFCFWGDVGSEVCMFEVVRDGFFCDVVLGLIQYVKGI